MNYAYLNHIAINEQSTLPVYLQLRDGFKDLITAGILQPQAKLPASRVLSDYFNIHRKTVVAAMDELLAEGWIVSVAREGLYVNEQLPLIKPRSYGVANKSYPQKAGYSFGVNALLIKPKTKRNLSGFDDGYPDGRLAPIAELSKAYTQALSESTFNKSLSRILDLKGSPLLRTELANAMHVYRGLPVKPENILITKGSQMSLYLVAALLIKKGDNVVVTSPNYITSNITFETLGANVIKVGVDTNGMNVDDVEAVCKKKKIRCLYVTSHHHHPTTVTLSIDRRLKLLQLAQQYGFAIIEDDYDYDFHYENKPLLPIASNDKGGNVIYIGSFSKTISHVFRVGYIIAPEDFINELTAFRKIVDRHGDLILEEAIGKLLANNTIKNYTCKALNIYRVRRDNAYALFTDKLADHMTALLPEGGLAFWTVLDKNIPLKLLSEKCYASQLYFPDGVMYNRDAPTANGCRLGFASMNEREMENAVNILKQEIRKLK